MRKPRFSIRMQVLLLALAFTLIIAVGVCVASIRSYYRKATRTTAQSIEYNLQVAAGRLLQDVNEINNLADWCTVDSSIRGYALTSHWQTYLLSSYNTLLNKYSSQHTSRYLRRVLISDGQNRFLQQGTAITYSKALTAETVTSLPLFADGTNADSWTLIADDPLMTVSSGKIIPVLRTMANTSTGTSARVYIAVSINLITDAVSGYSLEDDSRLFWIMNGRAHELKDNSLLPVEIVLEGLEDVTDSFGPDLLDTRTRVMRQNGITILVYPVGNDGLYLAQTLPSISVMTTVTSMYMPLLGALLMILLLGLAAAADDRGAGAGAADPAVRHRPGGFHPQPRHRVGQRTGRHRPGHQQPDPLGHRPDGAAAGGRTPEKRPGIPHAAKPDQSPFHL